MSDAVDERERLQLGANRPPLAELLAEETADDRRHMEELVTAANNAVVVDQATQAQTAALGGLLRNHQIEVEGHRVARKRPFDQDAQTVQDAYLPILNAITAALKRLRSLNDAYEREQDRLRETERRRLAAEEERKRREAEEAARAAEEAKAAGKSGISAELARIKAEDEAAAAANARQAIRAEPIRTDLGTAHRATVKSYEIVDLTACLAYLRKTQRAHLVEAIQRLINRLGRAGVKVPGVEVHEEKTTRFGR